MRFSLAEQLALELFVSENGQVLGKTTIQFYSLCGNKYISRKSLSIFPDELEEVQGMSG